MKHLFDPTLAEDIKQRIMRLHPESERRWGNMTVAQTLAHCTSGIQMATGVINPKRASFPANVIGLVIKPLVFSDDKPMRRNSPSSPELFSADPTRCDFERERTQLIATIDSFANQGRSLLLPARTSILWAAQTTAVGYSHVQTRRPSPTTVRRVRVPIGRNPASIGPRKSACGQCHHKRAGRFWLRKCPGCMISAWSQSRRERT